MKKLLLGLLLIIVSGACIYSFMIMNDTKEKNTKVKNSITEITKKMDKLNKDNDTYTKEIDNLKKKNEAKNKELHIWEKAKEKLKKAQ